jgi:hypothetical protein
VVKKILLVSAVLISSFSIFLTSVFKVSAKTLVQYQPVKSAVSSPPVSPTPTVKPEVKYYLPYPGILPDHSLYPFKMVRDRIWLWLTVDPLKKAELQLLFANKRIGAGKSLIEGGKVNLGITTIEKGEKYLEKAAKTLEEAKAKGKDVKSLAGQFKQAAMKHEEILTQLKDGLEGDGKAAIERLLIYPKSVQEKLEGLLAG